MPFVRPGETRPPPQVRAEPLAGKMKACAGLAGEPNSSLKHSSERRMGVKKNPQDLSPNTIADAIERHHYSTAQDWVDRGWNIFVGQNAKGGWHWRERATGLGLMAAFGGWTEFLKKNEAKILAQEGFNPNAAVKGASESEAAPLHLAAENGSSALIRMLVAWGADPNRMASSNRSGQEKHMHPPLARASGADTACALIEGGAKEELCSGRREGFAQWVRQTGWTIESLRRLIALGVDPLRENAKGEKMALQAVVGEQSGAKMRLFRELGATQENFLAAIGGAERLPDWIARAATEGRLEALRAGKEAFGAEAWAKAWHQPIEQRKRDWRERGVEDALEELAALGLESVTPWMACGATVAGVGPAGAAARGGAEPAKKHAGPDGAQRGGWALLIGPQRPANASSPVPTNKAQPAAPNYYYSGMQGSIDASRDRLQKKNALIAWAIGQKGFDPEELALDGSPLGQVAISWAIPRGIEETQSVIERLGQTCRWAPNSASVERMLAAFKSSSETEREDLETAISMAQALSLSRVSREAKSERRARDAEAGKKPKSPQKKPKMRL
jgi:hypothetical protein